ncbi:unnamed protein product [Adineta ricciae]|uniref:Uncharacterized protein n=1 Tax=Adineta ricciae TaxID=249248 RepID=A0A814JY49_ADIRI|nr:unnamed protein product [Adineta ricciae]
MLIKNTRRDERHKIFGFNVNRRHFNGGTIRWTTIDPSTNSISAGVTLIQSCAWAYRTMTCATDVTISTSGRTYKNRNLMRAVDSAGEVCCRSSVYVPRTGRRKRSDRRQPDHDLSPDSFYEETTADELSIYQWKMQAYSNGCTKILHVLLRYAMEPLVQERTTIIDTPGTLPSISSYPIWKAIDEYDGICFPESVPNGTSLSNCIIAFTELKANT